jgi:hypothetical protein
MMLARRTRDLHLTAPAGFDVFLDGLLALQPWARPHNTVCRLDEIEAQTRRALDGSLTFHRG